MQKLSVDTSHSALATRALTDLVLLVHIGRAAPTCRSLEDRDGPGGVRIDLVCDDVALTRRWKCGSAAASSPWTAPSCSARRACGSSLRPLRTSPAAADTPLAIRERLLGPQIRVRLQQW
jgi:hypothetical protein